MHLSLTRFCLLQTRSKTAGEDFLIQLFYIYDSRYPDQHASETEISAATEDRLEGIARAYLIRGGLRRERLKKCQVLAGEFSMFDTYENEDKTEAGICLFGDHGAAEMDMIKLQRLANIGHPTIQTVELESRIKPDMMTFHSHERAIYIYLHLEAVAYDPIFQWQSLTEDAIDSMLEILESHAATSANIFWPEGFEVHSDSRTIPCLPESIEKLTVQYIPRLFNDPIPNAPDRQHWIHPIMANFRNLQELHLDHAGFRSSDLSALKAFIPKLSITTSKSNITTLSEAEETWRYSRRSAIGADLALRYFQLQNMERCRDIVECIARQSFDNSSNFSRAELLPLLALPKAYSTHGQIDTALIKLMETKIRAHDFEDWEYNLIAQDFREACEDIMILRLRSDSK